MGKSKKPKNLESGPIVPREMPSFDEVRFFVLCWKTIKQMRERREKVTSFRQIGIAAGASYVALIDNLNRIERKYDAVLFDRKSYLLTRAGEMVYGWGEQLIALYESGQTMRVPERVSKIKVGIGRFPATVLAIELVHSIKAKLVEVQELKFVRIRSWQLEEAFANSLVDLWVGPNREEYAFPDHPTLANRALTMSAMPLMSYRHRDASNEGTRMLGNSEEAVGAEVESSGVTMSCGDECLALLNSGGFPWSFWAMPYRIPADFDLEKWAGKYNLNKPTRTDRAAAHMVTKGELKYLLPPNIKAAFHSGGHTTNDGMYVIWPRGVRAEVETLVDLIEALAWAIW